MIRINVKNNFNLRDTITCGQIFRYFEEEDHSYTIILKDRVINIKSINNELVVKSNNEDNLRSIIIDYFDLDRDYNLINTKLIEMDSKLIPVINNCVGLKMIKQDYFETVIGYIISINNSVPSIRNSLNLISSKYGKKVLFNKNIYYLFPSADELKNITLEELRTFKVGFRDKYLKNIIDSINDNNLDLNYINQLSTPLALQFLMNYPGIGPKVASCILLFSYQRFDVFPVDTWVIKYMRDKYNINNQKNIIEYAKNKYGIYSGIAIQYMFHSNRNIK